MGTTIFEVKKFDQSQLTGMVDYELQWDLGHGRKTDRGSFVDRRDAEHYVMDSKRSYILLLFGKYTSHANILSETGHRDFYKKEDKIKSLQRCNLYNEWLQDKSFEQICRVILALVDDMRRILPTPGNPSHSSSESKIMDMIVFCKRELMAYPERKKNQPILNEE